MNRRISIIHLFVFTCLFTVISCERNDTVEVDEPSDVFASDDSITSFLSSELPVYSEGSASFFVNERHSNHIYLINSMEELKSIYSGTKKLPNIDFSDKTLLIGQRYVAQECNVLKQEFIRQEEKYILVLDVEPTDWSWCMAFDMYFWMILPKVETLPIEVEMKPDYTVVPQEN